MQDSDGKSILQSALTNYYTYGVEIKEMYNCLCLLAEHGANINAPINSGTTLLHFASTRSELAAKLVECGGNVLVQDNTGSSALSNAKGRALIIYEEEACEYMNKLRKRFISLCYIIANCVISNLFVYFPYLLNFTDIANLPLIYTQYL